MSKQFISNTVEDTIRFGRRLGSILKSGDLIALCGELGSGKTVLTKGIARGLGVKHAERVNSPSFLILKEYRGRLPLYHFDIYRLNDAFEFMTVDYARYFYGNGVSVIEWADKIEKLLPDEFLKIDLSVKGENERRMRVLPYGHRYKRIAERLC
ncbi:MAG: tRNA (adenosine(37)-N6)-threonylcarbamoyltransferase complex ATPase subunit type 1 TsaE [Candidatus Omnitrophica bacterium]|nr:tRNA (adenosine(37)-N6)-threonylcarbamoyltransferase complex ATPase subunit type 1 TsaE [Candidatus Omnitrophota bacterium]